MSNLSFLVLGVFQIIFLSRYEQNFILKGGPYFIGKVGLYIHNWSLRFNFHVEFIEDALSRSKCMNFPMSYGLKRFFYYLMILWVIMYSAPMSCETSNHLLTQEFVFKRIQVIQVHVIMLSSIFGEWIPKLDQTKVFQLDASNVGRSNINLGILLQKDVKKGQSKMKKDVDNVICPSSHIIQVLF